VAALGVVLALAVVAGPASAHRASKVRDLRLHFRSLGIGSVEADGRYVVLAHGYPRPDVTFTLLNEETGTDRPLPQTDPCTAVQVFGGPWLFGGGCAGANDVLTIPLYSLATGTRRLVAINDSFCVAQNAYGGSCNARNVGSDWVQFEITAYHETTQVLFQNLGTGAIRSAPKLTATTELDLNSPTLTSRICPPLRQGPNTELTFYGRFAVDAHFLGHGTSAEFLVRCGSKLHLRLTSAGFGDSSALMWAAGSHLLKGIALPSLTRFEIRTPSAFNDDETSFTLSSKTLYAQDNQQHLWATAWSPPR
jgi:hypothetical protein